jgi:FAD-dependent oxidoreductase domain-containing protein 1
MSGHKTPESRATGPPSRSRYDVVIVGAGILGLASAYHLVRSDPGLRILVVDAQRGPGEGSTAASNAMARDVFSSRDNQVLAGSSIRFYRQLMEEREGLRSPVPLLDLYGYLWLLPEARLREYEAVIARAGGSLDATLVEPEDLRSSPGLDLAPARWYEEDGTTPPAPIAGGLFGRRCGAIAPELLVAYYHREAARAGVEFRFGACVQRLSFEGRNEILLHEPSKRPFSFQREIPGRLRISRLELGDGRSVATESVIVAAGAWAEKLLHPLGVATACSPRVERLFAAAGRPIDALLRWIPPVAAIDTDQGRARCPFLILPTGALLKPIFREGRMWLSAVDTVAGPIGVREDPVGEGRLDFAPARLGDRDGFATDVLPAITPYFPGFEEPGVRLESAWGGYYSFSPDGLPVLVGEEYGVLFVGGDSGSGVMKADALGRLVAAKWAGRRSAALFGAESYSVDRLSLSQRSVEPERIIL